MTTQNPKRMQKKEVRPNVILLILGGVCGLFMIFFFPYGEERDLNPNSEGGFSFADRQGIYLYTLKLEMKGPEGLSAPAIRPISITTHPGPPPSDPERITCYDAIILYTWPRHTGKDSPQYIPFTSSIPMRGPSSCREGVAISYEFLDSEWINLLNGNYSSYYPLDSLHTRFAMVLISHVTGETEDIRYGEETIENPVFRYTAIDRINITHVSGSRWRVDSSQEMIEPHLYAEDMYGQQIKLMTFGFYRPLPIVISTISLPIFVFIIILFVYYIPNFGDQLGVAAAFLLGLFGLRQVLKPNDIEIFTSLDAAILFLYLTLAIIVLASIYRRFSLRGLPFRRYYALPSSGRIHDRDCWIIKGKSERVFISYSSKEEALENNLSPCKHCLSDTQNQ